MPNILAGKMIMPEYIQEIDYKKAIKTFCEWLVNDDLLIMKQNELKKLKGKLKPLPGSVLENIAEYIVASFDLRREI